MSCKGQESGSNSLSPHHVENAAQQLPYTTLVEGALAFGKVSQIKDQRSVQSDRSLSMAVSRVEEALRRMPNLPMELGQEVHTHWELPRFSVQQTEECGEPYTRWPLGGH